MAHLLVNNYNKIILDDNSVFTEYSDDMRNWNSGTMLIVLVAAEDKLYIGAPHTFASRFVLMDGTNVNSNGSALTVKYYSGSTNGWRAVKNLADGTKNITATFGRSGFVAWDLPSDWVRCQVNSLPELPYNSATGDGYGFYWTEWSVSADLSAGTAIKWFGMIWTSQDYMLVRWPEVLSSRFLPEGESDWYELIEMSTGDVADDLEVSNIIDYEMQAKDINELAELTALKTLINILLPMVSSESLRKMREDFQEMYNTKLKARIRAIDKNKNEKIDQKEGEDLGSSMIIRT